MLIHIYILMLRIRIIKKRKHNKEIYIEMKVCMNIYNFERWGKKKKYIVIKKCQPVGGNIDIY